MKGFYLLLVLPPLQVIPTFPSIPLEDVSVVRQVFEKTLRIDHSALHNYGLPFGLA